MIDILAGALEWLSFARDYLIALALVAGGAYVGFVLPANPWAAPFTRLLRFLGVVLIALGVGLAMFTLGRSTGAANCEAQWKTKNLEAEIARLKQEAAVKQLAADLAGRQAADLVEQNTDLQTKVNDYAETLRNSAACRRATGDDDRRLCDITGRSAAGCSNP
ncbi:MAG: hypothetical protein KIT48_13200 [Pseudolabrys sp.]|nr:hypothetical protein [Pseudolabrys sp.]